jgi:hypothetical protein
LKAVDKLFNFLLNIHTIYGKCRPGEPCKRHSTVASSPSTKFFVTKDHEQHRGSSIFFIFSFHCDQILTNSTYANQTYHYSDPHRDNILFVLQQKHRQPNLHKRKRRSAASWESCFPVFTGHGKGFNAQRMGFY